MNHCVGTLFGFSSFFRIAKIIDFFSILFIIYYILLICFDIYSFIYFNVVFYILSQALLFLSVLIYYYKLMPIKIKKNMYLFIFLTFLVVILFINEKYNCKKMLSLFPHFPYHILIEIVGIVLFYLISSSFYKL